MAPGTPADMAAYTSSQQPPDEDAAQLLDGGELLASWVQTRLNSYSADYAGTLRAELRGEGDWRERPGRPGFGLPTGTEPVVVALVRVEASWQVPLALQYGGWNGYPAPAEHAAILQYFHERYGVELVALTATTAEFAVSRPPIERLDVVRLAWEYRTYNDGEYDYYLADTLTDLAVSLQGALVWRVWWD
jgi:hypothetical protein